MRPAVPGRVLSSQSNHFSGVTHMRGILAAIVVTIGLAACGPDNTSSSSSQTCSEEHLCQNGSCTCTAGPKKNNSCCDPSDTQCTVNKCDTYCKYCQ